MSEFGREPGEAPVFIDWEKPAETLEEANERIFSLYRAMTAFLGEGPFYDVTEMNKRQADLALHPKKEKDYREWDLDWTRAEGG